MQHSTTKWRIVAKVSKFKYFGGLNCLRDVFVESFNQGCQQFDFFADRTGPDQTEQDRCRLDRTVEKGTQQTICEM